MEQRGVVKRIYASHAGRFFLCLGLALLLFFAVLPFVTPTYYDNDDTNIAFALAGYLSGEPYPAHPFINPILSNAVAFLYRILPSVSWWLFVQLAAVILSLAATGEAILALGGRRGLPILAPLALYGLVAVGLFLYPLFLVTFTLTSACLGTAAAAMLLSCEPGRVGTKRFCTSLGFLALSFLFRNSSGYSMLCFYLGSLAFHGAALMKARAGKGALLRLAALTIAALALSGALVFVNGWGLKHYNAPEFVDFDAARGKYLDYPVDSYSDDPALYESVGWDQELYAMVKNWFYMDERVTAKAMNTILSGSKARVTPASAAEDYLGFLAARPMAGYLTAFVLLILLAALLAPGEGLNRLFALLMGLGGAALIGFLLLSGRIVLRAYQLVLIPTAVCVLLLGLGGGRRPARRSAGAWIAALALLAALYPGYKCARLLVSYDSKDTLSASHAMMEYVLDHPDTVFIRDTHVANNVDALTTYPVQRPTNLLDWGGTAACTGARERQLERYNLKPYTAEVFFREDVRFLSEPDSRDFKAFSAYLASTLNAALEKTDDVAEGIAVYRVINLNSEAAS